MLDKLGIPCALWHSTSKERACSNVAAGLSTAPKLLSGRTIEEHTDELELTTEDARLLRRCRVLPRLSSASGSHRPPPCRRCCRRGGVGAVRILSARWSGRASPRPHIRPRSLDKFRLGRGGAVAWCDGCRRMARGCRRRSEMLAGLAMEGGLEVGWLIADMRGHSGRRVGGAGAGFRCWLMASEAVPQTDEPWGGLSGASAERPRLIDGRLCFR
jgi:hypothetical protein